MTDQTRFTTLQTGITVLRELTLDEAQRRVRGTTFTLSLGVAIPFQDGVVKPLDIIVERSLVAPKLAAAYEYANGDIAIKTVARLTPEGRSFNIDVVFRLGRTRLEGAIVIVSQDMEEIILDSLRGEMDRFFENNGTMP